MEARVYQFTAIHQIVWEKGKRRAAPARGVYKPEKGTSTVAQWHAQAIRVQLKSVSVERVQAKSSSPHPKPKTAGRRLHSPQQSYFNMPRYM